MCMVTIVRSSYKECEMADANLIVQNKILGMLIYTHD